MQSSGLTAMVKERRRRMGLSQAELATRVGVSRQAILAIEAGRQIPSTLLALQLAQVLQCQVEDLFASSVRQRVTAQAVDAGSLAPSKRFNLGLVDGSWIAHPVHDGDQPGDALRAGELSDSGEPRFELLTHLSQLENAVLVAGCAPLLGLLSGRLNQGGTQRSTWLRAHSMRALQLLEQNQVHIAGVHFAESTTPGGHESLVRQRFVGRSMSIFNLTRWRQGLVVPSGNPLGIRGVADVWERKARFAGREKGASAQRLFERLWKADVGEPLARVSGPTAADHDEVARLVQMGLADVGVAIEAVALATNLEFIPLVEERFDLLVPESRLDQVPVARFLDAIGRSTFRRDAGGIPGYDLSNSGELTSVRAQ